MSYPHLALIAGALTAARALAFAHGARGGDAAAALVAIAVATAIAGWLHGLLVGPAGAVHPDARPGTGPARAEARGVAAFGVLALPVLAAVPSPWVLIDGLLAGVVFALHLRAGRGLAGQGRTDALLGWACGVVASGAIVMLLVSTARMAAGLPLLPGLRAVLWGAGLVALVAGFVFVRRVGWGQASLNLMFAMVPAFAGLLGVGEALMLAAGRPEAEFVARFLALVSVPVWMGAGLAFYLVGTCGGMLAMLGARRPRA